MTMRESSDWCLIDQERLDGRAVEDFIQAARDYPTADGYYNGICEYFYGVLIKERSACASLPYWMYRVKFTMAVDVLRDFDRPLARAICGLVAFHFNQFPECAAWMANARAGIAARRFSLWLEGRADMAEALLVQRPTPSLEMSLTDYESERVLAWSMTDMDQLRPHLSDIEAIVRQDIPEFDRNKLRILLAEYYVRNASADDARRHARELRSSPALGTWAARLLAQLRAPHGQGTTQR